MPDTEKAGPLIVVGAGLLGFVLGFALVGSAVAGFVLAGVAASAAFLATQGPTSSKDVRRTSLPAAQVIRQAVQEIGTERKWTATGHSDDFASFARQEHANCGIALLLACFGLLPGILYMLLGRRSQTLTINVFPEPDGNSSVQVSSSGGDAKKRGRRFLRGLSEAGTVTA